MTAVPLGTVLRHVRALTAAPAAGDATDRQLLHDFTARHDQGAFAALVRRHGPMVLGVCRNVLHNEQDAEDAFQATFMVLARSGASIRNREALSSYLHGVAYRTALFARRSAARRRKHEGQARAMPQRDASWEAAWREVQGLLDEEVQRLPTKYRDVFVLCHLEGHGRAEVARQLGLKEGTVSSRLDQARKLLRQRLARRGVALSAVLGAAALTRTAAAVPAPLTRAALGALAGTVSSPQAAALADGVSRALSAARLKMATVLLLTAGILAGGAGLWMQRQAAAQPGDVPQAKAAQPPAPAPVTPRKRPAEQRVVSGRVLGPDGKPFAGAAVYLWTTGAGKRPARKTGADGRFRLEVPRAELDRGVKVVASAANHVPDWADLANSGKGDEITLRLGRDDVPVVGRILDLEGRPVPGVTAQVVRVGKPAGGLGAWIDRNVKLRADHIWLNERGLDTLPPEAAGVPASATTGKDGRFRLAGFGRDRVLTLYLHGPTVEHVRLWAATRPGPAKGWITGHFGLYGAAFQQLLGPSKPIVGTVRDKKTGKPIAGAVVEDGAAGMVRTTTDARGRYRLPGVPKTAHYFVSVGGAKGVPYFDRTRDFADTPGVDPITLDFELERGVEVTGRLTDKVTGKPVPGHVHYFPLPTNPNRKDFRAFANNGLTTILVSDWGKAGRDGRFTVLAIPGPGVLVASAADADRFVLLDAARELTKLGVRSQPSGSTHALARIELSPKDPKSLRCDLAVEPGRTRTGTVLGPDGKPLAGVEAAGLTLSGLVGKLETADFRLTGLSPRSRRVLLFIDRKKKLGKVQMVRGDESAALVVRLQPLGWVTGRVVDADGRPLPGLRITFFAAPSGLERAMRSIENLPEELLAVNGVLGITRGYWRKLTGRQTTTDREGRFRIDDVLPGLTYKLYASRGPVEKPNSVVANQTGVAVEPGKTTDLGDLKAE